MEGSATNEMSVSDKHSDSATSEGELNDIEAKIPSAPAYCTRLTSAEARRVSDETTRRELEKLRGPAVTEAHNKMTFGTLSAAVDNASTSVSDMHGMLMTYAEKYGHCCDQLCRIAGELRESQMQLLTMKDSAYELQSQKEHYQGMAEQYEEDVQKLNGDIAFVRNELCRQRTKSSISIPIMMLFCIYTLFMFEMQRLYGVVDRYAVYRNFSIGT